MFRIILFLVLIALAAAGAAWVADQTGDVVLIVGRLARSPSLPVFVLVLGLTIVAVMMAWSLLRGLWRTPARLRRRRREQASGARPSRRHAGPAGDRPWR